MKRNLFLVATVVFSALALSSCESESASRSGFQPMNFASSNGIGTDTLPPWMDTRTHAYEFTALVNGSIQDLSYRTTTGVGHNYEFSIWEKTGPASAVLLASNTHTFVTSGSETISLSPVTITAGTSYIVVRNSIDASWTVNQTIGQLIDLSTPTIDSKITFTYGYFIDAMTPADIISPNDPNFYLNAWDYSAPGTIKVANIDFELL